MPVNCTPTIYSEHSWSTTKYPVTEMATVTSSILYNQTISTTLSTSLYPATVKKQDNISTIPNQPNHKTNHIPVHHAHTETKINSVIVLTHPHYLAMPKKPLCKNQLEFFYITLMLLTALCSQHLGHWQHYRQVPPQPLLPKSTNFWTM